MKIKNITQLKEAAYNPRFISGEALSGLKYSLEEFGDLSGITFNLQTGNLVTGHQRIKALKEKYGELEIIHVGDGVTGHIFTPDGKQFNIRFVNWDLRKEKAANVAANAETIQGEFTSELKIIIDEMQLNTPDYVLALNLNELSIPINPLEIIPASLSEQGKLDETEKLKCPNCGHEFEK